MRIHRWNSQSPSQLTMTLLVAVLSVAGVRLAAAQGPQEPVEGISDADMITDCLKHNFSAFYGGTAVDAIMEPILWVRPEQQSWKNTYANLRDKGAWVGIIDNLTIVDQPTTSTPPMVLANRRTCVWIGRDPSEPDSLRAYFYPEGGKRSGPRKVEYRSLGFTSPQNPKPKTHTHPQANFETSSTFGMYASRADFEKDRHPYLIKKQIKALFDESGTWYTCESNGCCRVH